MRCRNCGWENPNDISQCEKCGSPFNNVVRDATQYFTPEEPHKQPVADPMTEASAFSGTVIDGQAATPPPFRGNMMSTVSESTCFLKPQQNPEPSAEPAETHPVVKCPSCGYPLSGDIHECPYCHAPVGGNDAVEAFEALNEAINPESPAPPVNIPPVEPVAEAPEPPETPADNPSSPFVQPVPVKDRNTRTCPSCGATAPDNAKFCQSCGSSLIQSAPETPAEPSRINRVTMGTVRNATVIPGFGEQAAEKPRPVHYCTLRRREWPGEMVQYTPTTYLGETVTLNRMNTDQSNNTITSKQQAVITCENGQWFIEDRSALKSTYVRVSGKVPIKAGDIILLGNREFEFEGF